MFTCSCCGGSPPRTFYQLNHPFDVRCRTSLRMRCQFPGYVPVIFEPEEQCCALSNVVPRGGSSRDGVESSKAALPRSLHGVPSSGRVTHPPPPVPPHNQHTSSGSALLSKLSPATTSTVHDAITGEQNESVVAGCAYGSDECANAPHSCEARTPNDYSNHTCNDINHYASEDNTDENALRDSITDANAGYSVQENGTSRAGGYTVAEQRQALRYDDEYAAAVLGGANTLTDTQDNIYASPAIVNDDSSISQRQLSNALEEPNETARLGCTDDTDEAKACSALVDEASGGREGGAQSSMYRMMAAASSTFARRAQDMSVRSLWSLARRTSEPKDSSKGVNTVNKSACMGCCCGNINMPSHCIHKRNDSNTFYASRRSHARYGQHRDYVCGNFAAAASASSALRPKQQNTLKFIMPGRKTLSEVILTLRERLTLAPHQAIFLTVGEGNLLAPGNSQLSDLYDRYRNADGFLYIAFALENTFG